MNDKSKNPVLLSYKSENSKSVEYETDLIEDMDFNIILQDSNNERGWRIFHIVQSIELAKQFQLKEAFKINENCLSKR